ncbi:unnamed protein product [Calypogeia fissa]
MEAVSYIVKGTRGKEMSRIITRGLRSLAFGGGSLNTKVNRAQCRAMSFQAEQSAIQDRAVDETKASWPGSEVTPLELDISYPTYMIWGANTGVGKTLVSAGLAACILPNGMQNVQRGDKSTTRDVLYVKPVQTGYPNDSDARFVTHQVSNILKSRGKELQSDVCIHTQFLNASAAVRQAMATSDVDSFVEDGIGGGMKHLGTHEEQILEGSHRPSSFTNCHDNVQNGNLETNPRTLGEGTAFVPSHLTCTTIWSWYEPVSPHLAAEKERATVDDSSVLSTLTASLQSFVKTNCDSDGNANLGKWAIVETAGGVASPGPSGTLQCDLYRPLRLPGVLVGDGRLGGISTTISALDSLRVRGYDIAAVILLDSGLRNDQPLMTYLQGRVPVLVLSPVPSDPNEDLASWFAKSEGVFSELRNSLEEAHEKRIQRLQEMPGKAKEILWWPFTQHSMVRTAGVTVIDSRCGENFSVFKNSLEGPRGALVQQYDGCASWWTQGPDSRLQPELAREVGYTAARYGHVMFPENIYEPALRCAELLLQGVGKGWAKRVYYSDNGSTAIEIALKMAFRKFVTDHGFISEIDGAISPVKTLPSLKVLALKGSYHGDTLGAMEAQAPSSYTGALQQPWYSGRGSFLDPPTVYLRRGKWILDCPASFRGAEHFPGVNFQSREESFDSARDSTSVGDIYRKYIHQYFAIQKTGNVALGALIVEPVIHGSGGMVMVDPLFQRILVHACRQQNIPVIFDEVFAGCWRLGVQSAAELLKCNPDIACYSKLLTGGTIPLSATLATEEVFEVFQGKSKLDALLHGHSYSAHAMGCSAAVTSLKYFSDPNRNSNLLSNGRLQELWNPELVNEISRLPSIQRVIALGTVFACELHTSPGESGYASMSSKEIISNLKAAGVYARPLGNVLYLMCGPLTSPQTCSKLLEILYHHLPKEVPLGC